MGGRWTTDAGPVDVTGPAFEKLSADDLEELNFFLLFMVRVNTRIAAQKRAAQETSEAGLYCI